MSAKKAKKAAPKSKPKEKRGPRLPKAPPVPSAAPEPAEAPAGGTEAPEKGEEEGQPARKTPPPKKSGKRGLTLANAVHSAALDPGADFDTPTRKETEAEPQPQAHGSLLVEQPPKPKVVGDRFEVFYLKPIFAKTPKGDITVSLAITLPLEDSHDGLLPKIIHDGYRDITKKGRKGMTFTELPGQHAMFFLTSDIREESLVLPAAKMINASLALVQRKGEGEARKVIRLSFRLQVKLSKEVAHFAEHNLGNNFWLSLRETEEPLFDEEDDD
jgi:hypothetical protein